MFLRNKLRGRDTDPAGPGELGTPGRESGWMDVLSWAVPVEWGASFFFHGLIKNKAKNTAGVCMTSFQRVLLLVGSVAGVGGDRRLL